MHKFLPRSTAAAAAVLAVAAGLAAAPAAYAGSQSPTFHCVLPAGQGEATGPMDVTVDLNPATTTPGGKVTGKVHLGLSPATSPFPLSGVTVTPAITLAMSGGATGTATITGPSVVMDIPAGQIQMPDYEGEFLLPADASGPVDFTVTGTVTRTVVGGTPFVTPCDVVSGASVIASVTAEGTGGPAATLAVQPGTVRPGDTVTATGAGFTPGGTPKPYLCRADGTACDDGRIAGSTLAVDAQGALTGSATFKQNTPAGELADGAYTLKVSDGAKEATAPLAIKAYVPTEPWAITLSQSRGPLGTTITVKGKNFRPNIYIWVFGVDAAGTTLEDDTAIYPISDNNGEFTTEFTVNDPRIAAIRGQDGSWFDRFAALPFELTTGPAPTSQGVAVALQAGGLSMTQSGDGIDFGAITLDGTPKTADAPLNRITVVDARGGTLGWSLTGTMTDLTHANGKDAIPAGAISWTPSCAEAPGGLSTVTTGDSGPISAGATLCSQAASTDGSATGGRSTADARISLTTPAFTAAGTYSGTLTLSLI